MRVGHEVGFHLFTMIDEDPCLNRELSFSYMPTFQLVSYGLIHRKDSSTLKWLARKSDYQFDHFRILDSFQACLLICGPILQLLFQIEFRGPVQYM